MPFSLRNFRAAAALNPVRSALLAVTVMTLISASAQAKASAACESLFVESAVKTAAKSASLSPAEILAAQPRDQRAAKWQELIASGVFRVEPGQTEFKHLEISLRTNPKHANDIVSQIEYEFPDASRTHLSIIWTYTENPYEGLGAQSLLMRALAAKYPAVRSIEGSTTATNEDVINHARANGLPLDEAFRLSPAYRSAAAAGFKRIDSLEEIVDGDINSILYILSKP